MAGLVAAARLRELGHESRGLEKGSRTGGSMLPSSGVGRRHPDWERFRAGGFAVRLARERGLLLRANPWSEGNGLDFAVARGAVTTPGMDEFYGRVMPAPPARIREQDFAPLAQLYGREARVFTDDWREITPPQVEWHENDLAQLVGPRAWYVVEETNDRIEAARAAGGTVVGREEGLAVHVAAAVTHTIGGVQVDQQARVAGADGLWAAGA